MTKTGQRVKLAVSRDDQTVRSLVSREAQKFNNIEISLCSLRTTSKVTR